MTDTEPTPPVRPEGPADGAAAAPSPWAAEPRRYQQPGDPWSRPQAQDSSETRSQAQDSSETRSQAQDSGETRSPTQPMQPVAAPQWATPTNPWGQAGGTAPWSPAVGPAQGRTVPGGAAGWDDQQGWSSPPTGGATTVDTLGRSGRGRRGRGGLVALTVALSLVVGLLGGFLGSVVADRNDLGGLAGGGQTGSGDGDGDGSASSAAGADGVEAPAPVGETGSVAEIAARVLPSVVSISVRTGQGNGTGSGFVIDEEGLVVTNNHVIAAGGSEPAGDIVVELSDGSQAAAEVVGTDSSYDIAVLRIDPADTSGLTALTFGDSDRVVVGEQVVAVGAPLGLDATVTTGIISALNRPVSAGDAEQTAFINAIQTDAAINPGNSGGPLVNMRGEVVGVNSAIAQAPGGQTGGSIGLGFSIPSNQASRTAGQLVEDGVATFPVVGVLLDRSYTGEGVRIVTEEDAAEAPPVTPGGPADAAGLQAGDVILAFEGRPMTESDELVVAIRAREPGDEVTLTVRRDDEVFDVNLVLEAGDQG